MLKNTNTVDEKVVITKEDGALGGYRYVHPSYGMVRLCRSTGGSRELFGSDITHSNTMKLEISRADVRQDLGRSWYHDYEEIIEVEMSENQYATMVSSPNTQGVPCTIKYVQSEGYIKFKPHTKQMEYTELKLKSVAEDLSKTVNDNIDRVRELLDKKSALNKDEKKELLNLFTRVKNTVEHSIPFYQESLKENISDMKTEAKAEMEAYANNMMVRLGEKVAGNIEAIQMLISEDNSKQQNLLNEDK